MIAEIAFPVPLHRTFYYRLKAEMLPYAVPGLRVLAPFGPRTAAGLVIKLHEEASVDLSGFKELKYVESLLDKRPLFTDDIPELAAWMRDKWNAPIGFAVENFYGQFLGADIQPVTCPEGGSVAVETQALPPELAGIYSHLAPSIGAGRASAHILFGPPQNGRYELYLALITQAVRSGGQVLCLVPDLNLIGPFNDKLKASFNSEAIALWHSRLTVKQKRETWLGVMNGAIKIVVGARSAVFLPFKKISLAVMDEEQDDIYKQEEMEPHFHARGLLFKRAAYHGSCLVFGSACPSMEVYSGVAKSEIDLIPLPPSIGRRPRVTIVDMKDYPWEIISKPLAEKVRQTVEEKRQALVLAGRKGYSSLAFCANCGWTRRCQRCRIPMAVKKDDVDGVSRLVCWRCGKKEEMLQVCPKCSGKVFKEKGSGTQKVEEYFKKLLPGARVARVDGDVLKKSVKDAKALYDAFAKGGIDILVGTRLMARGHDFPNLGVIGVVDSDAGLSTADFRGSEKVFQTLLEAGASLETAAEEPEFIVQTLQPKHYIFSVLPELDYEKFAKDELASRRDFYYPPFSELIRINLASFDPKALLTFSSEVLKALECPPNDDPSSPSAEILGPLAVSDKKRSKLVSEYYLVKLPDEKALAACLARLRAVKAPKTVRFKLSADPYSFK